MDKPVRPPVLRTSEKVLLHLLRLRGALSKAELARLSNMSAQGVSIIVERLLDLDLVQKGEKTRGRVGQPSTPIALNPEGAVSMGVLVTPGEARFALIDFHGAIRAETTLPHDDPRHPSLIQTVLDTAAGLPQGISSPLWRRCVGIGLSAGEALLGHLDPRGASGRPARPSLATRMTDRFGLPVHGINDIRAACIAEMTMGAEIVQGTVLYLDIGLSFGAGLILEGRLIGPEAKLSSRLHGLVLPGSGAASVGDRVSLYPLAEAVEAAGFDFADQIEIGFADTRSLFETWQTEAVEALATAIGAAAATLIVDRVLLAGILSRSTLDAFAAHLRRSLDASRAPRRFASEISTDTVGPYPQMRGAAMVPLLKVFGTDEGGATIRPDHRDVA